MKIGLLTICCGIQNEDSAAAHRAPPTPQKGIENIGNNIGAPARVAPHVQIAMKTFHMTLNPSKKIPPAFCPVPSFAAASSKLT